LAALAARKNEAIEEYAVPIFNRLEKQGIVSFRFYGADGRLIYQADGGAAAESDLIVAAAIKEDKRQTGVIVEEGSLHIIAALPCYYEGERVAVLRLGSAPDRTLKAAADLRGNLLALYVQRGGQWALQSAT